jgi:hypothetical protein
MRFHVPEAQINFLIDKLHVGRSADYVREYIQQRIQGATYQGAPLTEAQCNQLVAYALKRHQQNCGLYHRVMTGRL